MYIYSDQVNSLKCEHLFLLFFHDLASFCAFKYFCQNANLNSACFLLSKTNQRSTKVSISVNKKNTLDFCQSLECTFFYHKHHRIQFCSNISLEQRKFVYNNSSEKLIQTHQQQQQQQYRNSINHKYFTAVNFTTAADNRHTC